MNLTFFLKKSRSKRSGLLNARSFFLISTLFPFSVLAAEPATPSVGRLLLGLLFMVALIFIGAWLIRRAPHINAHGAIKVIASTSLGTRERVVLLQVGPHQLLVGVTAHSITPLQTLSENIELPASALPSFQETLNKILKGNRSS